MRIGWRAWVFAIWLLLVNASLHAAVTVVIVSSDERNAAYTDAAQALISELERGGLERSDILEVAAAQWTAAIGVTPILHIALGTAAASVLANSSLKTPILCALLPRASFEQVLSSSGRKANAGFSAIYLDQPWSRELALIRLALPTARNIGVLWGPQSQTRSEALKTAALAQGFQLTQASVTRPDLLFPGLKSVVDNADVLLAVADPMVYNSSSIQNILLTSFRAKVPLLAFSPAYVQAGALLAIHVTPRQLGLQAGAIANGVLHGRALPVTPLYSQDFTISVNEHVAHSLGLKLDTDALASQLRRREAKP
jgi:ABC-type uncharacterized transport system substrate-binding protein